MTEVLQLAMILVAQQPNYFPWLGYFEQLRVTDALVILDSVQWIKQGMQHRVRIAPHVGSNEEYEWLTIPVNSHGHREIPLKEIKIDDSQDWAKLHWRTIQTIYGKAPFFKTQLEPLLSPYFEAAKFSTMAEASLASTKLIAEALNAWPKNIYFSSDFPPEEGPTDRLLSLCQTLGAKTYYTALGTSFYLDRRKFNAADIRVIQQNFRPPHYPSTSGRMLSVIDVLANAPLAEIQSWLAPKPWGPFPEKLNPDLPTPSESSYSKAPTQRDSFLE